MSVDRQQMLETAERLNQQMADGIPYTWETLEQALSFVTEKRIGESMEGSVILQHFIIWIQGSGTVSEVSGRKREMPAGNGSGDSRSQGL